MKISTKVAAMGANWRLAGQVRGFDHEIDRGGISTVFCGDERSSLGDSSGSSVGRRRLSNGIASLLPLILTLSGLIPRPYGTI